MNTNRALRVFNLTKILFSRQDLIFSPGIFSKNNHQCKWSGILKIFVQTILIFLYFYSFDICYANFFIFTLNIQLQWKHYTNNISSLFKHYIFIFPCNVFTMMTLLMLCIILAISMPLRSCSGPSWYLILLRFISNPIVSRIVS